MKTSGKLISAAAAASLLLIAFSSDDSMTGALSALLDTDTTAASAESQTAALNPAGVAARDPLDYVGQAAATDAWFAEAQSEIVLAQADAPVGPPRADAADDAAPKQSAKQAPRDKMSGPVAALAAAGTGMAEIVVRYDQHPELFDDERVADLGGEVTRSYEHLDMRAITIPAASLVTVPGPSPP